MTPQHLELRLKTLAAHGTRLPDAADGHSVWAFDADGETHHLHFFPAPAKGRGIRFFFELQALQKADVPAERPVALLKGFRVGQQSGDAVIVRPAESARRLGEYLLDLHLLGKAVPDRRAAVSSMIALLQSLHRAKRHFNPRLAAPLAGRGVGRTRPASGAAKRNVGSFLRFLGILPDGQVILLDPLALKRGAWREADLRSFGTVASRYATRTELLRGWQKLTGTPRPPTSRGVWPAVRLRPIRAFGLKSFNADGWSVQYADQPGFPQRHSMVKCDEIDLAAWPTAWPDLLATVERDELEIIKRDPSGDVLSGTVRLGSADLPVIVKRTRRVTTVRTPRGRRAWRKAWNLLAMGFAVEQPLLLAERRRLGRTVDSLLIFERVPGPTLAGANLDALVDAPRDMLLRRCGRVLRRLERAGFCHFDSKSTNWIVFAGPTGPEPVMLDLDGIRPYRWDGFGLRRLLRALRQHPQFRESDAAAVVAGYEPFRPTPYNADPR